MKKILLMMILSLSVNAEQIQMTAEQEKNWNISVEIPTASKQYPFGEFIAHVVTPPALLNTISLPFEANVQKLYVAKYQKVKRGDVLAEVTGTKWIEVQQKAISEAIEYKHHTHLTERKNILCKEEIIPQKECVAANAELKADKIRVAASKALLQGYGASEHMIDVLFQKLEMTNTITITSSVDGSIIELDATPGKSTNPSDALFVIKQEGNLWLEANIEAKRTVRLHEGQSVEIRLNDEVFQTKVLQISPVINPKNQTRQVRFLAPVQTHISAGYIGSAKLTLFGDVLKVNKNSVIKEGGTQIVFVKNKVGYVATPVKVLSEDDNYYYLEKAPRLNREIATNSLAILKNLLGKDDE
jgi:multidrug efflux pump subunit AcrA (membrane-fusion protein)